MCILVVIGTKAQFIKMAPVLKEMDRRGLPYRLVYTGQHSETFDVLEKAFGTRPADDVLVPGFEADTKGSFARWTFRFWWEAFRRIVKGRWKGIRVCLVHGDTMSALFGAVAARLAGIRVAHVEAGLRSPDLLDPFPEELVRRLVSRLSRFHFAPDATAATNLRSASGQVVATGGNTLRDALALSLRAIPALPTMGGSGGYGVVSIHRNENLSSRADFDLLMGEVVRAAGVLPLKFVLHPATRTRIERTGWKSKLESTPGLQLMGRVDYPEFVRLLVGSCLLLTDGGSNQEEAAMLGIPTLLLRRTTERPDGLGDGVELSGLQPQVIRDFVARHAGGRWKLRALPEASPSRVIVDALEALN